MRVKSAVVVVVRSRRSEGGVVIMRRTTRKRREEGRQHAHPGGAGWSGAEQEDMRKRRVTLPRLVKLESGSRWWGGGRAAARTQSCTKPSGEVSRTARRCCYCCCNFGWVVVLVLGV